MTKLQQQLNFLDASQRHVAPTVGAFGGVQMQVKGIEAEKREIRFTCSTKNVDRYGEVIEPKAFAKRMAHFKSNPVFIAGHVYIGNSGEPTVIGHWKDIQITADGLEMTAVFAKTELAEKYWTLYRDGHMQAVSVGFVAYGWKMAEYEIEGRKQMIRVFDDVEIVECSAVAIPANRQSLKQNGLDLSDSDLIASIKTIIKDAVGDTLKDLLNTDPGSPLGVLVQETVLATLGNRGHRCGDHGPEEDPEPDPSPKQADYKPLIDQLKGLQTALSGKGN